MTSAVFSNFISSFTSYLYDPSTPPAASDLDTASLKHLVASVGGSAASARDTLDKIEVLINAHGRSGSGPGGPIAQGVAGMGNILGGVGAGSIVEDSGRGLSWSHIGSAIWDPPLPSVLSYIPFICRLMAATIAIPFVFCVLLDLASYLIARTLQLYPKDIHLPRLSFSKSHPALLSVTSPFEADEHKSLPEEDDADEAERASRARTSAEEMLGVDVAREGSASRIRRREADGGNATAGLRGEGHDSPPLGTASPEIRILPSVTPSAPSSPIAAKLPTDLGFSKNSDGPSLAIDSENISYPPPLLPSRHSASSSVSVSASVSSSSEEDEAVIHGGRRCSRRSSKHLRGNVSGILSATSALETEGPTPPGLDSLVPPADGSAASHRKRNGSLMFERGSGLCDVEGEDEGDIDEDEEEGLPSESKRERDRTPGRGGVVRGSGIDHAMERTRSSNEHGPTTPTGKTLFTTETPERLENRGLPAERINRTSQMHLAETPQPDSGSRQIIPGPSITSHTMATTSRSDGSGTPDDIAGPSIDPKQSDLEEPSIGSRGEGGTNKGQQPEVMISVPPAGMQLGAVVS